MEVTNRELSWRAGPHLPSLRDFAHVGVLCTFSNIPPPPPAGIAQKLRAEQLLASAGGTVHRGRRYGPLTKVQIIAPSTTLLQLDRAGRRIRSILYTVKNAVELLGAPSRNSILMLKKYNITDEIFWLSSHVFFFYPANEQESSTLAQSKIFVLVSD